MESVSRSLSVLFLEDSEKDIEIVRQKLVDDFGCPVSMDTAACEEQFAGLLRSNCYDAILADYTLPGYNAPTALALARAICPETPFICVSGTIGEDAAVELLKQGATDYVLKDRLGRLSYAVLRALESARLEAEKRRAEREQENNKRIFEEAQRIAHVGSWEWDLQTNSVICSEEVYQIFGLDPKTAELYKGITFQYVSQEDRQRILDAQDAALKGLAPYDVQYPQTKPDGTVIQIHSRGVVHRDAAGKAVSMTGTMQDVTERERAETEIREAKESLKEAQRIAHIGSWDWDIAEGKLYWSDESFRLMGLEPSSAPTRSGMLLEYVAAADKDRVATALDTALKSHEPLDVVYCIDAQDGKTRYIHSIGHAEFDDNGQAVHMAGTMQDITERKLAEDALRAANESNRFILDSTNDSIAMFDFDGTILSSNKQFAEIFNKRNEDITGLRREDALPEYALVAVYKLRLEKLQRVFGTGEPEIWEDSRSGAWFSNRFYPVYQDGKVVAVTLFSTDITAQKNAEEEAKRHIAFERTIRNLAHSFINMSIETIDGAIEDALKLVGEYCGVDRTSIWKYDWGKEIAIRLYGWDRVPDRQTGCDWDILPFSSIPEVIECHKAGATHHIRNVEESSHDSRTTVTTKERNTVAVATFPLLVNGYLFGSLGFSTIEKEKELSENEKSIIDIFAEMILNVLLRKKQDETLRQLNESYRLMLDSVSDGVAMYDYDGVVLSINQNFAKRYGASPMDFYGRNLMDFLPEKIYGNLGNSRLEKFREAFRKETWVVFDDTRDGRWFRNRVYPVFIDGRVTAVTLFSTDITDQRKAEEETRRRTETEMRLSVMTEFFTNVSHELKTPLSLILMQIDMMHLCMGNESKMRSLMADATLNAYRLTRLVSNLLDITKMDAGFLMLNLRNRDIVLIVRSICESVAEYAKAREISLRFTTDMESRHMDLDSDKIERVVLNLLSNAIKHTPAGGAITVALRNLGEKISVSVADTGEGIPEDKLKTVFDRFVQVNNKLSAATEGTGIGLALVKSMVELHGGSISAQSELGRGSTFLLELPVASSGVKHKAELIEGFDLNKKVKMELSDLYIKVDA